MSVQFIAMVWADPYYGQSQKSELLIALALADFARAEDGKAWPGIEALARKARTSPRCAQLACKKLESAGKLRIIEGGGEHGTNAYYLLSPPPQDAPRPPCDVPPQEGCNGRSKELSAPLTKELSADFTQTVRNPQEPPGTVPLSPRAPAPRRNVEPAPGAPRRESGFEEFWKVYPKREDKGEAEKAWRAMQCAGFVPRILAGVGRSIAKDEWQRDGGRWVPKPAKWLRARGWEDGAIATAAPPDYRQSEWPAWLQGKGQPFIEYQFAAEFLRTDFHHDRAAQKTKTTHEHPAPTNLRPAPSHLVPA